MRANGQARRDERRLGIAELVARLGVSGRTITRWCAAGTFPHPHHVGVNRKWWLHEIEAWEAQQNAGRPAALERRLLNLAGGHASRGRAACPSTISERPPPASGLQRTDLQRQGEAAAPLDPDLDPRVELDPPETYPSNPTLDPGADPAAMGGGAIR